MKSYKFIIKGTVQHVYYRKNVSENATKENFNGYVKNLPNGNVEAAITCKEKELKIFMDILKKGSEKSQVTTIEQLECNVIFKDGFIIEY
jgi:acylphosphatase